MSTIHRKMGQTMAVALLPCQNAQKLWKLPVFGNGFKVTPPFSLTMKTISILFVVQSTPTHVRQHCRF